MPAEITLERNRKDGGAGNEEMENRNGNITNMMRRTAGMYNSDTGHRMQRRRDGFKKLEGGRGEKMKFFEYFPSESCKIPAEKLVLKVSRTFTLNSHIACVG